MENLTQTENTEITRPDYTAEITGIIKSDRSPKAVLSALEDYHENDIAQAFVSLDTAARKKFTRICPPAMLAEIFEYIDEDDAGEILSETDIKKAADLISALDADTAVSILREIQKEIKLIASFDDDEIGSKMTTNCIVISEGLTIKQAMTELIRQAKDNDNITTLFVVDDDDEYYGAIDLKDLITARSEDKLSDLIATQFPYVYATEEIDDCIERLKDYSESSIPVLDNSNKLLGVITAQSIIEVVDDEMGEDYARLAGLTAEEDLKEPLKDSIKKRLPWLLILLGLGIAVSSVVGAFEKVVAQLTLIMAFQSLILDMAGNVGTQSLAVTIRVLTDENLSFGQKLHLVGKEMKIGFFNGVILGAISFGLIGLYIMLFKGRSFGFSYAVSGCIGVSLLLAMILSSASGTLIPLFFKKIKVDPAVASGPLITTINDLVAVVTYYGMSWVLLINVLHLA